MLHKTITNPQQKYIKIIKIKLFKFIYTFSNN